MTSSNHRHLTAFDTQESVRTALEPHLHRQWERVLGATRRSAFAAAYGTIVNADPSADHADVLNASYWAAMQIYEATLEVLCDFSPDDSAAVRDPGVPD